MRWERFVRNCAFSVILFLLVNALDAASLPGAAAVREYLVFAFTSDWDYRPVLAQAQAGVRALSTYRGRLKPGEPPDGPSLPVQPAPPADLAPPAAAPVESREPPHPAPAAAGGPRGLVWPAQGRVSAGFGPRKHPIYRLAGPHEGLDIAAPAGAPVSATADGRVTSTFRGLRSGLTIDVAHDGFTTRYAHLSAIKVKAGDAVQAGTVLGLVGNTGVSTGPHLHFEVRVDGRPVDPLPLLPR